MISKTSWDLLHELQKEALDSSHGHQDSTFQKTMHPFSPLQRPPMPSFLSLGTESTSATSSGGRSVDFELCLYGRHSR